MNRKKYIIFNTRWHSIIVVMIFLISFSADFVFPLSLGGRGGTVGSAINVALTIIRDAIFNRMFFQRLAVRFPTHREEMRKTAKLLTIFGQSRQKRRKGHMIDERTAVMAFIEGAPEAEQIGREWKSGLRWSTYGLIGCVLHLPLLLLFSGWLEATQQWIWSYFHIFGG